MKTILLIFVGLLMSFSSDKPAYLLFEQGGKKTTYQELLKKASQADVVLFGELHNNPICHWLELELAKDLWHEKKGNLTLGAEMFEADAQIVLNEYLSGKIKENHLETEGKVWTNYKTDYSPLVNFAKTKQIPFIATNVPRRYASLVSREGLHALDSLPDVVKQWLCPLPLEVNLELPGYKAMLTMMGGHGGANTENFPKAQALKDATMAYFILKHLPSKGVFLHYHGTYHSNNFEGIYWYLKKQHPSLNILTIASVEQPDIQQLADENKNLAHFILAIPTSMTKTY